MMDTSQGHMTGGPGCTVEVNESLFGWLNHNLVSYLNCVVNLFIIQKVNPSIGEAVYLGEDSSGY